MQHLAFVSRVMSVLGQRRLDLFEREQPLLLGQPLRLLPELPAHWHKYTQ